MFFVFALLIMFYVKTHSCERSCKDTVFFCFVLYILYFYFLSRPYYIAHSFFEAKVLNPLCRAKKNEPKKVYFCTSFF